MKTTYKRTAKYYRYGRDNYGKSGYSPEAESYAFATPQKDGFKRSSTWFDCRESLDKRFTKTRKALLLYDGEQKGGRVVAFMREVEKRLNVEPKSEIQGFKNTKNVCCIQFSPWWMENSARRQLLTILLRCGLKYQQSFKNALYNGETSGEYMEATREAVERFFKGFTDSKIRLRGGNGWVEYFDEENYDFDEDRYKKALEKLQKPTQDNFKK